MSNLSGSLPLSPTPPLCPSRIPSTSLAPDFERFSIIVDSDFRFQLARKFYLVEYNVFPRVFLETNNETPSP